VWLAVPAWSVSELSLPLTATIPGNIQCDGWDLW
jgi:hypothetical protein